MCSLSHGYPKTLVEMRLVRLLVIFLVNIELMLIVPIIGLFEVLLVY